MLYVLSSGPVLGLHWHGYVPTGFLKIYAPLRWASEVCEPLYDFLKTSFGQSLFGSLPPRRHSVGLGLTFAATCELHLLSRAKASRRIPVTLTMSTTCQTFALVAVAVSFILTALSLMILDFTLR